jgi:hypothetical protein
MPEIRFETKPFKIDDWTLVKLPQDASAKLPSRAMTMVEGAINGAKFKDVLEPDGRGSHWFKVDEDQIKNARVKQGENVIVEITPTKDWIEPKVPQDLQKALDKTPEAKELWSKITPNARWDWIRWIRAVMQAETRDKHIQVALSKLKSGERRPCCFNRNLCSEPYVSKNWQLREPIQ